MASPLHKSPRGLLELFGLNTLGRAPDEFGGTVTPSIDVTNYYGADLQFTSQDTGAAGAFPRTVTGTVGSGLSRPGPIRLLGLSGVLTLGAAPGTRVELRVGIRCPLSSSPTHWLGSLHLAAGLAAAQSYVVTTPFTDLVLLPGCSVVAQATGDAAGADHVLTLQSVQQLLLTS